MTKLTTLNITLNNIIEGIARMRDKRCALEDDIKRIKGEEIHSRGQAGNGGQPDYETAVRVLEFEDTQCKALTIELNGLRKDMEGIKPCLQKAIDIMSENGLL